MADMPSSRKPLSNLSTNKPSSHAETTLFSSPSEPQAILNFRLAKKQLLSLIKSTFLKQEVEQFLDTVEITIVERTNLDVPAPTTSGPNGETCWSPQIDKLYEQLRTLLSAPEYGLKVELFVKPSGSLDAPMLLKWHYPPMKTLWRFHFGLNADPSNECFRAVAQKLKLDLTEASLTNGIMHMEKIHYRFETPGNKEKTPEVMKPYSTLSQEVQDVFAQFEDALYELNGSPISIWLGQENRLKYERDFSKTQRIKLGFVGMGVTDAEVAIERDTNGTIRRLAFFSYHPQWFFFPQPQPLLLSMDRIWTLAAHLSGLQVEEGYWENRRGAYSADSSRHPLSTDWQSLSNDLPAHLLLQQMRVSEILFEIAIPLERLPTQLTTPKADGSCPFDVVRGTSSETLVTQMLVDVCSRAGHNGFTSRFATSGYSNPAEFMLGTMGPQAKAANAAIFEERQKARQEVGEYEFEYERLATLHPEWDPETLDFKATEKVRHLGYKARDRAIKEAGLTEKLADEKRAWKAEEAVMATKLDPLEFQKWRVSREHPELSDDAVLVRAKDRLKHLKKKQKKAESGKEQTAHQKKLAEQLELEAEVGLREAERRRLIAIHPDWDQKTLTKRVREALVNKARTRKRQAANGKAPTAAQES